MANFVLETVNLAAVVMIIILFNSYFLRFLHSIKKRCCFEALYERSHHLLILANLSNFIQSTINIIFGVLYYEHSFDNLNFLLSFYTIGTFFSRFYAMSICLRVFRISALHKQRHGTMSNQLQIVFKWQFNVFIIISYSLITTGMYYLIYFKISTIEAKSSYIRIIYVCESITLFILSYIAFNRARHPSIALEYIFYSIFWLTGSTENDEGRCMYTIPIRNSLLLIISSLSMHAHSSLIRPSFPAQVEFSNIFEIKEIYENFSLFVKSNGSESDYKGLKIYFKVKIYQLSNNEKMKAEIIDQFLECKGLVCLRKSIVLYDIDVIEDCLKDVLMKISEDYLKSDMFRKMKREYFVKFN